MAFRVWRLGRGRYTGRRMCARASYAAPRGSSCSLRERDRAEVARPLEHRRAHQMKGSFIWSRFRFIRSDLLQHALVDKDLFADHVVAFIVGVVGISQLPIRPEEQVRGKE